MASRNTIDHSDGLSKDTSDSVTVGSSGMVWLRLFGIRLFRVMGIPGLFGISVG